MTRQEASSRSYYNDQRKFQGQQMNPKALVRAARVLTSLLIWSYLPAVAQQPHNPTTKSAPTAKADSKDWTLGEFRKKYLSQRILILRGNDIRGFLGGWEPFKLGSDGAFYQPRFGDPDFNPSAYISFQYKDQTPMIIAIRQSAEGSRSPKQAQENAMGEALREDDIVNPHVDVFVRFDDGQLAEYENLVSNIRDRYARAADPDQDLWDMEFMLVSDIEMYMRK